MDADLDPIAAALDDDHLHALIEASNDVSRIAPGLLAWIEHAADWEANRRRGVDFPLLPPEAAIPTEEDAISIPAATMLRGRFAQAEGAGNPAVVRLFDAIAALLAGNERRH